MQRSSVNIVENKPKMVIRNRNDVTVTWQHTFENKTSSDVHIYVLQLLDELKEWKTVYWGKKTEYKIKKLAPFTCYSFRIRVEPDKDWVYFKVATEDEGPYFSVMHFSRAIKMGNTSLIRKIAHLRPHLLEIENKENKTPIIQAIENNDIVILSLLITLGANVNTPLLYNKRTPLMIAVYKGNLEIAAILIEKGACKNAIDVNGMNFIHYAVDSDRIEAVKFCLDLTENVNQADSNGWTPLLRSVIVNSSRDISQLLLDNAADPEIKDKLGFNYYKYLSLKSVDNLEVEISQSSMSNTKSQNKHSQTN